MNQKANFKTVTLKDLWGVFVQRLWSIILAACICCGGFLVFNRMTFVPQYDSTATLYILRQADGATASDKMFYLSSTSCLAEVLYAAYVL